jgi:ABC-type polysaccharide/polyol phosphate export permease
VYSVAFTQVLGLRRPAFVYFLLVGMLAWTFFASTLAMASASIVDSGGLLKSVRFPRAVLPLANVLFHLLQYLTTFAILLPIMLVLFEVRPAAPMLAYPLVLLLLVGVTAGAALLVAAAAAYFRDVKHLLEISLSLLFWMTPIIYDLNDAPEYLRLPILLSPLSAHVTALHDIFYLRAWPDASVWIVACAWSTASLIGGVSVFLALEDRFAEQI